MTCHLARIDIFPVKSLDGVSVSQATVLASGALESDRTYALFDAQNRFVNGKRTAAIHHLRSTFSKDGQFITLAVDGHPPTATFHLQQQRSELEAWLSDYFQQLVTLQVNSDSGFPDDTDAAGPTVISTATLQTVADWYCLSLEETRRRFRTNLEIDGVPSFWEDQLFSADGSPVRFAIGNVVLEGINPCQRCIVPTRDTLTGIAIDHFQKKFSQQRAATLPDWAHPSRFNHFYKLAVNTNIVHQGGHMLKVGDSVSVI
ncbi:MULTISPECIES: MOSC N-terminal beta barrel domain-containing protein [Cyanophyceae]|uniref:MOSC domain-containing protein n=1 Tax=Cyanophyceae TaxID=3028117 RepID=UPI001684ACD3|nr:MULTISPECIES: MOSC N-terminal beta barrel domain-containing protein [Cyanophyceae]MBD1914457.1 MOSC N-terminal beta barrel domain-containing protein [Phormidium sp. FACHB-77]MBD2031030.1 MOSC N-terminal beta barrel domain-containing protein [Phormidium sp. FACHB-322]MBD2052137.1 MOSC N-terminal beta barrel domain-containing protein [Leptolyngbya sp. FACHB-60]